MEFEETKFQYNNRVQIKTTKNVKYLSAPPGSKISPDGIWLVVAAVANELLLTKDTAIIRIPAADVLKIKGYDRDDFKKICEGLFDGKTKGQAKD